MTARNTAGCEQMRRLMAAGATTRATPGATPDAGPGRFDLTRRATLGGLSAAMVLGGARMSYAAAATTKRLVVLNVRGAMDGLAAVIPYGDPSLAGLRGGLVPAGMAKIDSFYALHPSLANFTAMLRAGQGLAIHAVGPVVSNRSHISAQSFLQSGTGQTLSSGWLNRAIALSGGTLSGVAMAAEVPLLLRGPAVMAGYAPEPFPQIPVALSAQAALLAAADPVIGPAMAAGVTDRALFDSILQTTHNSYAHDLASLATVAGTLLAASSGPRVVMLESDSLDTHDDQNSRLPPLLGAIDAALLALKTALGPAWASTVVLTMTEFGRTAYQNGTGGTDHGTAYAVLLAGGAVAGGRVLAQWPGLTTGQLFQGRDLMPTVDFRSIAMGVLFTHLGLPTATQQAIFPGSLGVAPMAGLIRS